MKLRIMVTARVGIGCGNPLARLQKDQYIKHMRDGYLDHVVISGDELRDASAAKDEWKLDVGKDVLKLVRAAVISGNQVYVDSDFSSIKSMLGLTLALLFTGAHVEYSDIYADADYTRRWIKTAPDKELSMYLPWYFQHHKSVEFAQYPTGPERGRAVAENEINRYKYWKE